MMRQPSATSLAVDGIVDYIRTHHLREGDPLPSETFLSEHLGCSRSSVREAMRTLVSLDIVEVRHGHGTYVSKMSLSPLVKGLTLKVLLGVDESLSNLTDIVDLRAAFDHAMAPELVKAWVGQDVTPLLEIVNQMRVEFAAGRSFESQDRAFHKALLAPVSNPLFRQLSDAFWQVHMATLPEMDLALPSDIELTIEAHADMTAALHDGDLERFNELVDAHYEPLLRGINRLS